MAVQDTYDLGWDLSREQFAQPPAALARFMKPYQFGISALTTKINILKDDFSDIHLQSPIEHVTSRLKSADSILHKAQRIHCPLTVDAIRENILDIAGVRITCGLLSDTYRIAALLTGQPDVSVIEVEDYIANPKPNGYKSVHMIIALPIFTSSQAHQVPVELQIRTVAMDFWASLERKIYYKYDREVPHALLDELTEAAEAAHRLDVTMERLHDELAALKGTHDLHLDLPQSGPHDEGWPRWAMK